MLEEHLRDMLLPGMLLGLPLQRTVCRWGRRSDLHRPIRVGESSGLRPLRIRPRPPPCGRRGSRSLARRPWSSAAPCASWPKAPSETNEPQPPPPETTGSRPRSTSDKHFLKDPAVSVRIASLLSEDNPPQILEVGPGTGALTRPLLERFGKPCTWWKSMPSPWPTCVTPNG